jgi:hypothetical protein
VDVGAAVGRGPSGATDASGASAATEADGAGAAAGEGEDADALHPAAAPSRTATAGPATARRTVPL